MAEIKFTGNLGNDSELKYTQSGQAVLNFSVADSKSQKQDDGTWKELSNQWLRVAIWGELAEFYAEKLLKGTRVTVWGDFMSREYEANGEKRISLDVTAKGIDIFQKRGQQGGGFGGQQQGGFGQQQDSGWSTPPQGAGSSDGWGNGNQQGPPF